MIQLRRLPQLFRTRRRGSLTVDTKGLQPSILEWRDLLWNTVRRLDTVVVELVAGSECLRRTEQDGVERVHRDVRVEVIQGCQEETGCRGICAGVWRILGLRLKNRRVSSLRLFCSRSRKHYQMMHADVDPSDQILLSDVLPIEELMEVDDRFAWEVHIPHTAGSRLRILAKRYCEVISSPIRVIQQPLRPYYRLQFHVCK